MIGSKCYGENMVGALDLAQDFIELVQEDFCMLWGEDQSRSQSNCAGSASSTIDSFFQQSLQDLISSETLGLISCFMNDSCFHTWQGYQHQWHRLFPDLWQSESCQNASSEHL